MPGFGRVLPFIDHSRGVPVGDSEGLLVIEYEANRGPSPSVRVGGRDLGRAPIATALPEGRHEIVWKRGTQTSFRYVMIRRGRDADRPDPGLNARLVCSPRGADRSRAEPRLYKLRRPLYCRRSLELESQRPARGSFMERVDMRNRNPFPRGAQPRCVSRTGWTFSACVLAAVTACGDKPAAPAAAAPRGAEGRADLRGRAERGAAGSAGRGQRAARASQPPQPRAPRGRRRGRPAHRLRHARADEVHVRAVQDRLRQGRQRRRHDVHAGRHRRPRVPAARGRAARSACAFG